jgi:DNA-binding Xre family transcriptional regulator
MKERGLTAYALAKATDERVSLSTAYRLCRLRGRLRTFDADVMEALCDALKVTPGELLQRDNKPTRRPR